MVYVIGSLIIFLIGLISAIVIYTSMQKLSKGVARELFFWLFSTIAVCGLPYALWNFLIESKIIVLANLEIRELVGVVLVGFFFLFMLKTAFIAKKFSEKFGFE